MEEKEALIVNITAEKDDLLVQKSNATSLLDSTITEQQAQISEQEIKL